jgi:hypothetical protein
MPNGTVSIYVSYVHFEIIQKEWIYLTVRYLVNEKSYRVQNGRDIDLKPRLATSLNVKLDVSIETVSLIVKTKLRTLKCSFLSLLG